MFGWGVLKGEVPKSVWFCIGDFPMHTFFWHGPIPNEYWSRKSKKVVCPSQKLSAQVFLHFLQLLELFSRKCIIMIEPETFCDCEI